MEFMTAPLERLKTTTPISFDVLPTPDDVWHDFVRVMVDAIRHNNSRGRRTTFIIPVGPTGQFKLLAGMCNHEKISCRDLVTFNMDEYCFDDGTPVPLEHPMSFRGFMRREFFGLLDTHLRPPEENNIFPDPARPTALPERIKEEGGVDICFGGIGMNGHMAFNEPPEPGEVVNIEDFRASTVRVVSLARETRAINAAFGAGGDIAAVPSKAVTVGLREILEARKCRFYLDWPWQAAIARRVLFGPVTPACPASYLQTHADAKIIMAAHTAQVPSFAPS